MWSLGSNMFSPLLSLQIQNVLYDFFQKPELHLGKYTYSFSIFSFQEGD